MIELDKKTALKQIWFTSNELFRQLDLSLGAIHGIGFTEYMVLDALVHAPENSMRRIDLAQKVSRTASGVTRILAPMEKIGLVEKAQNPRDARVSLVGITASGKQIWQDATESIETKINSIFSTCNDEQISTSTCCLRDIERSLLQR